MPLDNPKHLDRAKIVNMGSFYTPHKYVVTAGEWLINENVDSSYTIMDSSCGYGAFFSLSDRFHDNKYIGNDIDKKAIEVASKDFSFVRFYNKNALVDISRSQYDISETEKLIIVGNPPYNDTTSQAKQKMKTQKIETDPDVASRDLGLSSLKSYAKLSPDYALILHPLSYLIKKTNFNNAIDFFSNYSLINHIIFPSSEFANTSPNTHFPIIMALYKKQQNNGLNFEKVNHIKFNTVEGHSFSISGRDYIGDYIKKYPHKERYEKEILFYTMRDINALKRSRTFIKERIANAVDVDPRRLDLYCYVDCFKRYADIPYYLGNFDIPFIKDEFDEISQAVINVSKYNNRDIFGDNSKPSDSDIIKLNKYLKKVINY